MDVMARVVGEQLSKDLGQPVIVDNKPGAGGGIGVQALLSAPADGQVIMVTASNVLTEIPHVIKTNFDPLKDVRPILAIARVRNVLVTGPAVPAQDFAGLVAYLKGAPGKYSYGSHSSGTASHYAGLFLSQDGGLDLCTFRLPARRRRCSRSCRGRSHCCSTASSPPRPSSPPARCARTRSAEAAAIRTFRRCRPSSSSAARSWTTPTGSA